jgi:Outer membrane protein beta-barrel domain
MRARFQIAAAVAAGLLVAAPVHAQGADPAGWRYGTTLTLNPGVASGNSEAGGTLGGALGWELTPRLAVEGLGTWLDRPESPETFSAAIRSRYALVPRRSAPFIEGGFGMFITTIDPARATVPEFYRNRMADETRRRKFTDPAFFTGAGWTVVVSRHISLQPALEWTIVTDSGHGYTLTTATLRIAYHFEDHPVTP